MTSVLTLLSSLIWWVLFSSVGAVLSAVIAWVVLRWSERTSAVFNRVYLACLIWCMFTMLLSAGVAAHLGIVHAPFGPLIASGTFRASLVLSMLVGVVALWRLVPRIDAHRIRLTSACFAVAAVMAIAFGVVTTLASG
jgi:hypothetical protein